MPPNFNRLQVALNIMNNIKTRKYNKLELQITTNYKIITRWQSKQYIKMLKKITKKGVPSTCPGPGRTAIFSKVYCMPPSSQPSGFQEEHIPKSKCWYREVSKNNTA